MGLTLCEFESKTTLVELVLLRLSSHQMMHTPRLVPLPPITTLSVQLSSLQYGTHLHLQRSRLSRPLLPSKNMKIIIRRVSPSVTLRPKRGSKEDEVLRDTRMDNEHRSHSSSSIVPYPLWRVGSVSSCEERRGRGGQEGKGGVDGEGGVGFGEGGNDVGHDGGCVIWVGGDGVLAEEVQGRRVEDVPPGLAERFNERDVAEGGTRRTLIVSRYWQTT